MCGICGYIGQGQPDDLARMTRRLAHRGPDAEGFWQEPQDRVFLGHRRLSIVDLATGDQPMLTPDGELSVVFNGEIYNHRELRAQLSSRGHVFRTDHSDTEVLLHGYREWGRELPNHLNGMWAFALYDRRARALFLCRDRFGKKPLFYAQFPGMFGFASEVSALTAHSVFRNGPGLSNQALIKYFAYGYIPAPLSIFEGVQKLPAAHSLFAKIADGRVSIEVTRYWRYVVDPFQQLPKHPERDWGEELLARLDGAVRRRLVADVPVGIFLSGGIDSSAVTALAAKHAPAGSLETFSVGFAEPSFDESTYARQVAETFGTRHHEQQLSLDAAAELLPEIARRLDEPMGDSSLLPTYLLSRFTREHVKVALGGDGGDELFAGYDPFRALRWAQRYQSMMPKPVHAAISALAARLPVSHRNMSLDFKLKRTLRGLNQPPRLWLPSWMAPLSLRELCELFGQRLEAEAVYSEAIAAWDACAQENLIDRTSQFYVELYLPDDILVKVDRASMMHGLEVRAPFLDFEVVDFVRRIPAEWKFRHGVSKYLLKSALSRVLPESILKRRKKGFGAPIGAWFRSGKLALDPSSSRAPEFTAKMLNEHRRGRQDQRAFMWNAWLLQQWEAGTCPPSGSAVG